MSKLKVLGLTVLAISTAALSFVGGHLVGAQREEEKRFTEPLHSAFIMSCIGQGVPLDLCLCSEEKLYKFEPQIQEGQQIFEEFIASIDQCAKEIPEDLD